MRKTASSKGIDLTHMSRQIMPTDLDTFEYVILMYEMNLNDIKSLAKEPKTTIALMRSFGTSTAGINVPDPYFGGDEGFEDVFKMLNFHTLELLKYHY